jgi:uncharacterized lipoprotein YddW (UPF0748 family)
MERNLRLMPWCVFFAANNKNSRGKKNRNGDKRDENQN